MARRPRRQLEEEPESHERWLVSYADMITVLMALFIVLFAMSQVDETKYQELKQSLRTGFGQSGAMMHDRSSVLAGQGRTALSEIHPDVEMASLTPEQVRLVNQAVTRREQLARSQRAAEVDREVRRLEALLERLARALRAHGLEDDVRASIDRRGLVVSLVSRHVVFDAHLATLTERGEKVVDTLAPVLADVPDALEIDGHTNQAPVQPKFFASDWDLSAARAITVLRRLHEVGGIPNDRLSATAHGMERPLVDPSAPGSQRLNKRVDIVLLSDLPAESRELLADHGLNAASLRGVT